MEVWKLVLTAVFYTYLSYDLTRKSLNESVGKTLPRQAERLRNTINTLTGQRDQYLDSPSTGYFEQQKNRNSGVEIDEIDDTKYPIVPYKETTFHAPRVTQSARSRGGFASRGPTSTNRGMGTFGSRGQNSGVFINMNPNGTRESTRRTRERRDGNIPSFTRRSNIPARTF